MGRRGGPACPAVPRVRRPGWGSPPPPGWAAGFLGTLGTVSGMSLLLSLTCPLRLPPAPFFAETWRVYRAFLFKAASDLGKDDASSVTSPSVGRLEREGLGRRGGAQGGGLSGLGARPTAQEVIFSPGILRLEASLGGRGRWEEGEHSRSPFPVPYSVPLLAEL